LPYPGLATPVDLGPMRLRNRIVLNPHELRDALSRHVPVHLIGDARNPRDVGAAVREAYAAAELIGADGI
jgi:hypothetical protein